MTNQVINKENITKNFETAETDRLLEDVVLVNQLASDETAHGPVSDELKALIVGDIKRDLSGLMEESENLKAIFVIAINSENQYRSIHSGDLPALSRIVMLTSVESMKLAQILANDIRDCNEETTKAPIC